MDTLGMVLTRKERSFEEAERSEVPMKSGVTKGRMIEEVSGQDSEVSPITIIGVSREWH
jgi:hypothetical protein